MIKFNNEKVLLLQQLIIQETGGSLGVRDVNLLNSAIESCYQTFDKKELYPTKEEKCAKLCFSLISNHAFLDGNKRIGILVMLCFAEINKIPLTYTQNELIQLGLSVAQGLFRYEDILNWIINHKK